MVVDWTSLGPAIAAIVAIIGLAGAYYRGINNLSSRITTLEADSRLFWTVLQPHLAQIIHSPVHKRRDFLVDEFNARRLSDEELQELACELRANIATNGDNAKVMASALLLSRVEAALRKPADNGGSFWRGRRNK